MAENDIATSSLKRFRKYILDREENDAMLGEALASFERKGQLSRSGCPRTTRRGWPSSAPTTAPSHITNMDEIPLTFNIPQSGEKGTITVAIRTTGHEKSSFTVVLGCHGNGQSTG
ncbi:hypothetical protein D4764_0131910 [Takifugu flavidus]|uniref:Uncharacterized protein n=1 Tax=Takifugu flavidus TaxID=433684 RepID=A0A5C6MII1_9TELE|nr:hypothetical protein D4764_0131910 [Takifugu flavidus]